MGHDNNLKPNPNPNPNPSPSPNPNQVWATIITEAAQAAKGCVFTPAGQCIGPLPIEAWLELHLPPTLALLRRTVFEPVGPDGQVLTEAH